MKLKCCGSEQDKTVLKMMIDAEVDLKSGRLFAFTNNTGPPCQECHYPIREEDLIELYPERKAEIERHKIEKSK